MRLIVPFRGGSVSLALRIEAIARLGAGGGHWSSDICLLYRCWDRKNSPEGRFENSPAVYCRGRDRDGISSEGTAESTSCLTSTPIIMVGGGNNSAVPSGRVILTDGYPPLKGWAILEPPSGRTSPPLKGCTCLAFRERWDFLSKSLLKPVWSKKSFRQEGFSRPGR